MTTKLLLSGLLLLAAALAVQVGAEVVRAANVNVTAANGQFEDGDGDQNTTVQVGDTLIWTFADNQPHSVTSDTGAFDSGAPQTGGTYQFTFNAAGTYAYHCTVHGLPGQGMYGTITVQAAPTNTPQSGGATNTAEPDDTAAATRTSTPAATSTGSVTPVPPTSAATATPVVVAPVSATQTASGGAAPVTAPAAGVGTGGSAGGFRIEMLTIALAAAGVTLLGGAALARRRI